jgi:hypothetical protein
MRFDYTETAYRGEPTQGPGEPVPIESMGKVARYLRREPIPFRGTHCGEFLYGYPPFALDSTKPNHLQQKKFRRRGGMTWSSALNPVELVEMCSHVMLFFGAITGTAFIVLLPFIATTENSPSVLTFFYIMGAPLFFYGLLRSLLRFGLLPDRNNAIFYRHSGLVEIPWKDPETGKKPTYIPFGELDPYIGWGSEATGGTAYHLVLAHRYSERALVEPGGSLYDKAMPCHVWETLAAYMDVTRPIPDTPDLEWMRPLDATTRDHDTERGRPPRFWRAMTIDQFESLTERAKTALEAFPWGKSREQAKAEGWHPSRMSQVEFGEMSYDELGDYLARVDPENGSPAQKGREAHSA